MNEFLQFVYTVIDDDSDEGVIRAAHAIDEGQFLQSYHWYIEFGFRSTIY